MRFADLLRTTVLLSAGVSTLLAAVTIAGARDDVHGTLVIVCVAWWAIAVITGATLGRGVEATEPIAKLLADARAAQSLPEPRPTAVVLNRLWPLLLCAVVAGALAFLLPQVAGIAAGFAMIWALSWRHQEGAVRAIEQRDGVAFYVERTSPLRAIRLVRAPGFRRDRPSGSRA